MFKVLGIIGGVLGCLVLGFLFYVGEKSPETFIYPGNQVPKKYMETIRSLDLLEENEKITYFYTDALFDIKDGFYFVTDRKLVLYSNEWDEPISKIPYEEISQIETEYDDSFLNDSMIFVMTYEGDAYSFPLSSEKGLDKKFVDLIRSNMSAPIQTDEEPAKEDQ